MYEITVHHEIDAAHRVVDHPGKCRFLHGHRWSFDITVQASELNDLAMVADFGIIKDVIKQWDHRTLLWSEDLMFDGFAAARKVPEDTKWWEDEYGILRLPVNPTSERLAQLLATTLAAGPCAGMDVYVQVHETPSTSSAYTVPARSAR